MLYKSVLNQSTKSLEIHVKTVYLMSFFKSQAFSHRAFISIF